MEKLDRFKSESASKGNSEDSLLVIYILQTLKKYSSPKNPLSSQDVMDHLRGDYSIGNLDKADAQRKKVRRHLDTLHESYCGGCIKKVEGKTRNGHKWYYDITRDKFANEEGIVHETLSEVEVELLIDLILSTKILNSEGTRGIVDKLLKKTSISNEDKILRLAAIQKEGWFKTPNSDLVEKKDLIEGCFENCCLTFDYEDEKSITVTPLGWRYDEGICFLHAKVGDEHREFALDKIRISDSDVDSFEDLEDFRCYDEEADSDKTTLDSLLVNIPTIKSAIVGKKCIRFLYRSYAVANDRVVFTDEEKSVLPHSLVFNNGKYYLIGIDENTPELNKIAYFRVDLMFELYYAETKIKLSNWDKHVFETIERARLVEKHPLMMAGKDVEITFKVVESALDRVIDAFAVKLDKFSVTKETRMIKDSFGEEFHEERILRVKVRTTVEEAFRWSLANADAVELVSPQEVRDRIARLADPIHKTYARTMVDRVRENIDYIRKTGVFKISMNVDEDTAFETYKKLKIQNDLDLVNKIHIGKIEGEPGDYFGNFVNAQHLNIRFASNCKNIIWASNLTKISSIDIFKTQIRDVSWLKAMEKLRVVEISETPICDLSVLKDHKHILLLNVSNTLITDIGFIESYERLCKLDISGCPIKDYTPLLKIRPLDILFIDEKAVEALGMEALVKHHPDAVIKVQQKIDNRKV